MRTAFVAPALAVQFLTIIPLRLPRSIPDGAFPGAVALFPLVGLAIGGLVASVDALLGLVLPRSVIAAIDLAFLAVLSGGLHLDGLADAVDGLLGNLRRERRLEVMREGGIGAFGVVAVVLVLLLEYGGLVSLGPVIRFAALVAAVALSRWAMSLLLWAFPYARAEGAGSAFRSGLRPAHLLVSTLLAGLIVAALFCFGGVLLLVVSGGVALLVGWYAVRRVGGCTGDVYGAGGELAFAATLVAIAGLAR
jgi:adenosylcobinamide-GDP ribazoletransferase